MKKLYLVLSAALLAASLLPAQGPLNPPAPPGETMKTLQEIHDQVASVGDHRIALSQDDIGGGLWGFVISKPGHYYLTENVTIPNGRGGFFLLSSDIIIDLNGYQVLAEAGAENSLSGAYDGAQPNPGGRITIRNGTFKGFDDGINVSRKVPIRLEGLNLIECRGHGIDAGTGAVVRNCYVESPGAAGIYVRNQSVVESCQVVDATEQGIRGVRSVTIRDCTSTSSGTYGFQIVSGLIDGCTSHEDEAGGIYVTSTAEDRGAVIKNCRVERAASFGIRCDTTAQISDCFVSTTAGNGVGVWLQSGGVRDTTATSNSAFKLYCSQAINCTAIDSSVGFEVSSRCHLRECSSIHTGTIGGTGFSIQGSGNRVEECHAARHTTGIALEVGSSGNFVFKNVVYDSTTAYRANGSNQLRGDVISSAGVINGANAWVNYSLNP